MEPGALQEETRFQTRREPGPERGVAGQVLGQRIDAPDLEIDVPAHQRLVAVTERDGLSRVRQTGERHRAEEADGVVLDAVALEIAGDYLLVLAPSRPARLQRQLFIRQPSERGFRGMPVLPQYRFEEAILASDGGEGPRDLGDIV